jgi:uncharacterized phage infection (PIP) family protein YhgE
MRSLAIIAVLSVVFVAGCSDDSDDKGPSAQETFCADATQLRTSLGALGSLDLIADGTNALTTGIETVRTDFDTLKVSAKDNAKAELDALDAALGDLESGLAALGSGDITVESATGLLSSVAATSTAGSAVVTKLAESCG